jgi:hypothetical protein
MTRLGSGLTRLGYGMIIRGSMNADMYNRKHDLVKYEKGRNVIMNQITTDDSDNLLDIGHINFKIQTRERRDSRRTAIKTISKC